MLDQSLVKSSFVHILKLHRSAALWRLLALHTFSLLRVAGISCAWHAYQRLVDQHIWITELSISDVLLYMCITTMQVLKVCLSEFACFDSSNSVLI